MRDEVLDFWLRKESGKEEDRGFFLAILCSEGRAKFVHHHPNGSFEFLFKEISVGIFCWKEQKTEEMKSCLLICSCRNTFVIECR